MCSRSFEQHLMERKNIFFTINDNLESANWFKNSFGYPFAHKTNAQNCVPFLTRARSQLQEQGRSFRLEKWRNNYLTQSLLNDEEWRRGRVETTTQHKACVIFSLFQKFTKERLFVTLFSSSITNLDSRHKYCWATKKMWSLLMFVRSSLNFTIL